MMITWKKRKIIILILSGFVSLCLISILLLDVRMFFIQLIENIFLQRQLEDPDKWHKEMLFWSVRGIAFFAFIFFIILFFGDIIKQRMTINKEYINEAIELVTTFNYKQFLKPVLIMFGIYVIGTTAILRADFLYIDDIGRAVSGYRGWGNWSRHLSSFLAVFFHTDTRINDISPLTQFIAILLIAISSVMLVYVINDKIITKTALVVSLPVGLSPYFLECLSYKFDSPYMALSVFVSIIPFVFRDNKLTFSIFSIICMLIMCMTYQASSGIFIIIVIFLCFKQWNEKQKTNQEIFSFLGISILLYCVTMIVFRIFFMRPDNIYASTNMYSFQQIIPGILDNIYMYYTLVRSDFSSTWKILLLLVVLTFWIKCIVTTKRQKLIAFPVNIFVVILMVVLSFGVFIVLAKPIYVPRGMYGFGIFIAVLGIYTASIPKRIYTLPALILCWCFFVFSFSYGNALAAQKNYIEFRNQILLHDLAILFPEKSVEPQKIKIIGTAGYSPVVYNIAVRNNIIKRLVPIQLQSYSVWGGRLLTDHYNYNAILFGEYDDMEEEGFEQILDSRYHIIKSDGERVIVILK